jgi:membrane associated rhomboid family serine protease
MLPLKDSNPTRNVPYLTLGLIAANVAIFLLWQPTLHGGRNPEVEQQVFFLCHAEIPYEMTHQTNLAEGGVGAQRAISADSGPGIGPALQEYLQRRCPNKSWLLSIFVAMFLHGGWLHIGGNMLFLWVFGNNVEDRLGRIAFLLFYAAGGLAATALQVAFGPNSTIPNVGASGAIAAVLGAYVVLFPRARVTTLVIFFFITIIELPASVVLIGWFVLQLFQGVGELATQVNGGGVAYWAHVGGFGFGALAALAFFRRSHGSPPPIGEISPPRPDLF